MAPSDTRIDDAKRELGRTLRSQDGVVGVGVGAGDIRLHARSEESPVVRYFRSRYGKDEGIAEVADRPGNVERRHLAERLAGDGRLRVDGAFHDVDSDLAGESVTLWWGMFDQELFVELQDRRFGPYFPSGGPIPLHRYRKPRKSATPRRADRIGDLAGIISVPRAALSGVDESLAHAAAVLTLQRQPFVDPDPCGQFTYASRLDALRGVSDLPHRPLARLDEDDLAFVNALVERTLDKAAIEQDIRTRFLPRRPGAAEETSQC